MTLFMTSCGGKKSSRNWGRILDTTRASLGKPFLILEKETIFTGSHQVRPSVSELYKPAGQNNEAVRGVPVEEDRDSLHGNNDGLAVWGLRVRAGRAARRASFLLA